MAECAVGFGCYCFVMHDCFLVGLETNSLDDDWKTTVAKGISKIKVVVMTCIHLELSANIYTVEEF